MEKLRMAIGPVKTPGAYFAEKPRGAWQLVSLEFLPGEKMS
jgi:hypothetical protein